MNTNPSTAPRRQRNQAPDPAPAPEQSSEAPRVVDLKRNELSPREREIQGLRNVDGILVKAVTAWEQLPHVLELLQSPSAPTVRLDFPETALGNAIKDFVVDFQKRPIAEAYRQIEEKLKELGKEDVLREYLSINKNDRGTIALNQLHDYRGVAPGDLAILDQRTVTQLQQGLRGEKHQVCFWIDGDNDAQAAVQLRTLLNDIAQQDPSSAAGFERDVIRIWIGDPIGAKRLPESITLGELERRLRKAGKLPPNGSAVPEQNQEDDDLELTIDRDEEQPKKSDPSPTNSADDDKAPKAKAASNDPASPIDKDDKSLPANTTSNKETQGKVEAEKPSDTPSTTTDEDSAPAPASNKTKPTGKIKSPKAEQQSDESASVEAAQSGTDRPVKKQAPAAPEVSDDQGSLLQTEALPKRPSNTKTETPTVTSPTTTTELVLPAQSFGSTNSIVIMRDPPRANEPKVREEQPHAVPAPAEQRQIPIVPTDEDIVKKYRLNPFILKKDGLGVARIVERHPTKGWAFAVDTEGQKFYVPLESGQGVQLVGNRLQFVGPVADLPRKDEIILFAKAFVAEPRGQGAYPQMLHFCYAEEYGERVRERRYELHERPYYRLQAEQKEASKPGEAPYRVIIWEGTDISKIPVAIDDPDLKSDDDNNVWFEKRSGLHGSWATCNDPRTIKRPK